jgi:hypothetical protein
MRKKISLTKISPWQILIRTSLACGLGGAILFSMNLQRIEPLPLNLSPPQFDASNAHQKMIHLSKKFSNRVTWGESRKKAANWIKDEFQGLGYTPKSLGFSEVIAGTQYNQLENIYVEKRGSQHPNEIVVAMAHYDITDTTKEGAMDDASGVGVVLELARVFSKVNSDRTLIFLLTDSEEFGAFWGARAFANSYERADQIVAALNFDFISPGKITRILTLCDGLKSGYTPLWFREIALDSIRSLSSVEAKDMYGLEEFVERSIQIPPADHGAFLAAGIPALNWVAQPENFGYVMAHYHHTQADIAEELTPQSFVAVGQAAERVLKTIDQLPKIPNHWRDSSYWKISEHYYLPGWIVTLLQILAFLPFLAFSLVKFAKSVTAIKEYRQLDVIKNELKQVAILFTSMLSAYGFMLLLPVLRIITQYETFPATQKSLILYSPNFLVMALVLLAGGATYGAIQYLSNDPLDSTLQSKARHTVLTAILTFIIFLAFLKNSYLATLLLLPSAYCWMVIDAKRNHENRAVNGFLLAGGAITFIAIAVILNTVFHVGVFYWYLFLSTTYGLISSYATILFLLSITVMIRLFRSFVL